jgi:hypothetical protein
MLIDELKVLKEDGEYVVSDADRSFTISSDGVPSKDWFCGTSTIKKLVTYVKADNQLVVEVKKLSPKPATKKAKKNG